MFVLVYLGMRLSCRLHQRRRRYNHQHRRHHHHHCRHRRRHYDHRHRHQDGFGSRLAGCQSCPRRPLVCGRGGQGLVRLRRSLKGACFEVGLGCRVRTAVITLSEPSQRRKGLGPESPSPGRSTDIEVAIAKMALATRVFGCSAPAWKCGRVFGCGFFLVEFQCPVCVLFQSCGLLDATRGQRAS